jgi:hypothetical protein
VTEITTGGSIVLPFVTQAKIAFLAKRPANGHVGKPKARRTDTLKEASPRRNQHVVPNVTFRIWRAHGRL